MDWQSIKKTYIMVNRLLLFNKGIDNSLFKIVSVRFTTYCGVKSVDIRVIINKSGNYGLHSFECRIKSIKPEEVIKITNGIVSKL